MAEIFVGIAAVIHIYIFILESLLWGRPKTSRVFAMTPEQAEQNRLFAFNQGFYNLFLAIAGLLGVALSFIGMATEAQILMSYSAASMLGAGVVLLYSNPKLVRAAIIQGLPPLLGLVFLMFL